jgi:hypothetical protein
MVLGTSDMHEARFNLAEDRNTSLRGGRNDAPAGDDLEAERRGSGPLPDDWHPGETAPSGQPYLASDPFLAQSLYHRIASPRQFIRRPDGPPP